MENHCAMVIPLRKMKEKLIKAETPSSALVEGIAAASQFADWLPVRYENIKKNYFCRVVARLQECDKES